MTDKEDRVAGGLFAATKGVLLLLLLLLPPLTCLQCVLFSSHRLGKVAAAVNPVASTIPSTTINPDADPFLLLHYYHRHQQQHYHVLTQTI